MVELHWKIDRDPFAPGSTPFVSTPIHAEALARLAYAVESGERRATLRAAAGLGKTMVLTEALAQVRAPNRRIALAAWTGDISTTVSTLARGLGHMGQSGMPPWRALFESLRLCRMQRLAVVLAVDGEDDADASTEGVELARLASLDPSPTSRVTVLRVGRGGGWRPDDDPWGLPIHLVPLSRSEAGDYLRAKLASAGRLEPVFTLKAVTRLHGLTGGVPRGLDRLASFSLRLGAARGVEAVTPEVVDGVAEECLGRVG